MGAADGLLPIGRAAAALILGLALAAPASAQQPVTDAVVRAFVLRQERAWNGARLNDFYAAFTADAAFTDQAWQGDKPPVVYGTATLSQARIQSAKALARAPSREAGRVFRIETAADGASARVVTSVVITTGARQLCASREQTLVVTPKGLLSKGQTDTYIRCRRR